jgi:hypothetical protein
MDIMICKGEAKKDDKNGSMGAGAVWVDLGLPSIHGTPHK